MKTGVEMTLMFVNRLKIFQGIQKNYKTSTSPELSFKKKTTGITEPSD